MARTNATGVAASGCFIGRVWQLLHPSRRRSRPFPGAPRGRSAVCCPTARGDDRMSVLASKLNPRSEEFKAHAAAMRALVDDLNAQLRKIADGGGEVARTRHLGRGKLLPRE